MPKRGRNKRHAQSICIEKQLLHPKKTERPYRQHARKQSMITKMGNYAAGDNKKLPDLVPMKNAGSVQSI